MNLYGRFLLLILRNLFFPPPKIDIFSTCKTPFRVNLLDLDLNFHMNNGRYLSLMDLGRMDLMMRAGVFSRLFKMGYFPVVVSQSIRFKKSLEFGNRFEMNTTLESWDEKDFYIRQEFVRGSEIMAVGYIKGRFRQRKRQGSVPTSEIFNQVGLNPAAFKKSALANQQDQIHSALI